MKEKFSLPRECELNYNIKFFKHTALKLDKPALIVSARDNLGAPAYYVSFSKCGTDITDINSIGKIIYYDKLGCGFLDEYYYFKERKFLFQTRFKQFQEGVVNIR